MKKLYSRYFLVKLESRLSRIKNKHLLLFVFKFFYPLFFFKLPQFHINYKIINDDLFCLINNKNKRNYHFFNFKRISRYLINDGFEGKGISLAKNYQILNNVKFSPDDIVIEVGPNVGELTSFFVSKKAIVHLFEIDPLAINCLKLNFNNEQVILNECGAWNLDGESYIEYHSKDASSTLFVDDKNDNLLKIRTIKLSTYIKKLQSIKLLKIEAEGGEPEVLEGIEDQFYKIDYIALDCGPERNKSTTIKDCKTILETKNFNCTIMGNYLFAKNEK